MERPAERKPGGKRTPDSEQKSASLQKLKQICDAALEDEAYASIRSEIEKHTKSLDSIEEETDPRASMQKEKKLREIGEEIVRKMAAVLKTLKEKEDMRAKAMGDSVSKAKTELDKLAAEAGTREGEAKESGKSQVEAEKEYKKTLVEWVERSEIADDVAERLVNIEEKLANPIPSIEEVEHVSKIVQDAVKIAATAKDTIEAPKNAQKTQRMGIPAGKKAPTGAQGKAAEKKPSQSRAEEAKETSAALGLPRPVGGRALLSNTAGALSRNISSAIRKAQPVFLSLSIIGLIVIGPTYWYYIRPPVLPKNVKQG